MNILSQVTTGIKQNGQRIVIAGVEKVGKTTLACAAPGALLVPLEQGYSAMPVTKTPMLETWEQVLALCDELRAAAIAGKIHRGSSIAWDSATAIERLIHNYILRSDPQWTAKKGKITMESAHEGYGKAYSLANNEFDKWLFRMDELAFNAGINIVITCHVFPSRVVDPAHGEYDTWDLLLHSPKNNKTYGKREHLTQWADLIAFFYEPMFVMKAEEGESMNRGMSQNQGRVLAVDRTPAWVAGNRYGMTGTLSIPKPPQAQIAVNSWNALATAIHGACGIDIYNRSAA
jgi:hypothetical protein